MVPFVFAMVVVVAVLGGLYWRWTKRIDLEIAEGAAFEWDRLHRQEPELIDGLDRTGFDAIYRRVNFPRFPGYALACIACFLLSLPVTFGALAGGILVADRLGLTPAAVEVADRYLVEDGHMRLIRQAPPEAAYYYVEDLAGFYYFFGLLAVWLVIVAVFMHRYHSRRPGYLRDEIIRAR